MSFDAAALVRDYGDPWAEAAACRADAALFDFSFMARGRVRGPAALRAVEALQPRPMADLAPGRIRYAVRLDDRGAVAADLTVWRIDRETFEVMSGRPEDIADLCAMGADGKDLSAGTAVLSLQGPGSLAALKGLADVQAIARLPYFGFGAFQIADIDCLVGRLGYTGERGFEFILTGERREALWTALAERARPAGFAAADILRIEAGFILFAHECRFGVSAAELGLGALGGAEPWPMRVRLIAFGADAAERPVLWHADPAVLPEGKDAIAISSACHSPRLGRTLGLGFVKTDARADLIDFSNDADRRFTDIRLLPMPFFDPGKRRPRGAWHPETLWPSPESGGLESATD